MRTLLHFFFIFRLQGLGVLCSPLHGDLGTITRTVSLNDELSVISFLSKSRYSAIF